MKIKFILLLLLGLNAPVFANPGDDIWDHITVLNSGLSAANLAIKTLGNDLEQLRNLLEGQLQQLKNEMSSLKSSQLAPHYIGEFYHGRLVFYVDEKGQHGLIASKIDVNEAGLQWRNGVSGNKITNARGDGIGAGETNTRLIIAGQTIDDQKGKFAALLANNFQIMEDGTTTCNTPIPEGSMCYGGWYLPSAFELQLLQKNLQQNNLSNFAPEFYWSSTEASVSTAWLINFSTGEITASSKSNTLGRVRPIARF